MPGSLSAGRTTTEARRRYFFAYSSPCPLELSTKNALTNFPISFSGIMKGERNRERMARKSIRSTVFLVPRNSPLTFGDLKRGATLILQPMIEHESVTYHFDALKRLNGKSALGAFYYAPVVFSEKDVGGKVFGQLLASQSSLLYQLQDIRSDIGLVVCGPEHRLKTVHLGKHHGETQPVFDEMLGVFKGVVAPKLILTKHCRVCPYEKRCLDQAKKGKVGDVVSQCDLFCG